MAKAPGLLLPPWSTYLGKKSILVHLFLVNLMFVLPGSVVEIFLDENSQHGDEPVAVPVGPSDIGATGADTYSGH